VQFTVITTDGAIEAYDGKYKVEDGVLKITPDDKNKPIVSCRQRSGSRLSGLKRRTRQSPRRKSARTYS
jgi:hypothetical protein